MTKNKEQQLEHAAIENYSVFSPTQKTILKILLEFDRPIPFDIIKDVAKASKQSFNFSIQGLLKLGFVSREKTRVYIYQVNQEKIKQIVDIYIKQKKLTKNS